MSLVVERADSIAASLSRSGLRTAATAAIATASVWLAVVFGSPAPVEIPMWPIVLAIKVGATAIAVGVALTLLGLAIRYLAWRASTVTDTES